MAKCSDMTTNWFARHFGCWSGRGQSDHGEYQQEDKKQQQQRPATAETLDRRMSITRGSRRFGQQSSQNSSNNNCAKDGMVKCCDKFCKNHCNLSMMRSELKGGRGAAAIGGGGRRSLNAAKGVKLSSVLTFGGFKNYCKFIISNLFVSLL